MREEETAQDKEAFDRQIIWRNLAAGEGGKEDVVKAAQRETMSEDHEQGQHQPEKGETVSWARRGLRKFHERAKSVDSTVVFGPCRTADFQQRMCPAACLFLLLLPAAPSLGEGGLLLLLPSALRFRLPPSAFRSPPSALRPPISDL